MGMAHNRSIGAVRNKKIAPRFSTVSSWKTRPRQDQRPRPHRFQVCTPWTPKSFLGAPGAAAQARLKARGLKALRCGVGMKNIRCIRVCFTLKIFEMFAKMLAISLVHRRYGLTQHEMLPCKHLRLAVPATDKTFPKPGRDQCSNHSERERQFADKNMKQLMHQSAYYFIRVKLKNMCDTNDLQVHMEAKLAAITQSMII